MHVQFCTLYNKSLDNNIIIDGQNKVFVFSLIHFTVHCLGGEINEFKYFYDSFSQWTINEEKNRRLHKEDYGGLYYSIVLFRIVLRRIQLLYCIV